MNRAPKISTIIPTFNQEAHLSRAIESAVLQRGKFTYEIIVSSDGSTDGTRAIIGSFRKRFPGLIVDVSEDSNVGISGNFKRLIDASSGDYLAVLEGDDFWIHPHKLELQKKFLEENDDCSMVFSKLEVLNEATGDRRVLKRQENLQKNKLDGKDFIVEPTMNLIGNFSCCLFRTKLLKNLPTLLYKHRLSEIAVAFYLENHGRIGFLDKILSVYRQHSAGVWTGSSKIEQLRSGMITRETVKKIAAPAHHAAIQKIIDEKYAKPLEQLIKAAPANQ